MTTGPNYNKMSFLERMAFYTKMKEVAEMELARLAEDNTDWSKVKAGTLVEVTDTPDFSDPSRCMKRRLLYYMPEAAFPFWVVVDMSMENATAYKYARLIKEKYYVGTESEPTRRR